MVSPEKTEEMFSNPYLKTILVLLPQFLTCLDDSTEMG